MRMRSRRSVGSPSWDFHHEADGLGFGPGVEGVGNAGHDVVHGFRRPDQPQFVGFRFSQQPEVADQPIKIQGLAVDGFQGGGVRFRNPSWMASIWPLDVGQGRPQFVGDVGHHVAALALRLFQGVGHVVERLAQFGDFVVAPHRGAAGQIARPNARAAAVRLPMEPNTRRDNSSTSSTPTAQAISPANVNERWTASANRASRGSASVNSAPSCSSGGSGMMPPRPRGATSAEPTWTFSEITGVKWRDGGSGGLWSRHRPRPSRRPRRRRLSPTTLSS